MVYRVNARDASEHPLVTPAGRPRLHDGEGPREVRHALRRRLRGPLPHFLMPGIVSSRAPTGAHSVRGDPGPAVRAIPHLADRRDRGLVRGLAQGETLAR